MAKRGGLGKGLDVLIPNTFPRETEKENLSTIVDKAVDKSEDKRENKGERLVRLSQIEPNREQPRKHFDEDSLTELAESIRQYGVISPLLVKKKGDYYEIIAGERRWRAAKLAGISQVPVMVKEYNDREAMEVALIENIQREDLNPMEEAQAYQKLMNEFQLRQEDLAERLSRSRSAIANRLRLLKLSPRVQELVARGEISEGHARALLGLEKVKEQEEAAALILQGGLSVRETEKLVRKMLNPPEEKTEEWSEAERLIYQQLEEELQAKMGTRVSIRRKDKEKGKIQIDYYSLEELERLMDLLRKFS